MRCLYATVVPRIRHMEATNCRFTVVVDLDTLYPGPQERFEDPPAPSLSLSSDSWVATSFADLY